MYFRNTLLVAVYAPNKYETEEKSISFLSRYDLHPPPSLKLSEKRREIRKGAGTINRTLLKRSPLLKYRHPTVHLCSPSSPSPLLLSSLEVGPELINHTLMAPQYPWIQWYKKIENTRRPILVQDARNRISESWIKRWQ